ncbi:acetyltransferase, N-acetylglutamate synthase [Bernardetia litoralis DSM 6794]|uniref:Acetyltransferase, N-acetylglutamate synthase n=1 Tax=Bernardetia litoralis (strain ATCC 23117 / DSM 6794 / NBRC 15988 / NCIMB 1366 / Fx l1 / Sio-4) TaxID=880071 RepID=I4ANT6_BERLS|nr:GNAT family N-acetyltransferase [Bernardetia litoralis]AFM05621.1 acetyltransferase, N-acetylglutamate synthase [Bernardetia litoralis DSM 6794]
MLEFRVIEHNSKDYWDTVHLRELVLRQPLGMRFSSEELELENNSYHIAAYDENKKIVGAAMFVPLSSTKLKMRQVVIADDWQGRGIGKELIEFAETFARSKGYKIIEANVRQTAIGFYEKLNYQKQGKEFMEVGISHIKVEKNLN